MLGQVTRMRDAVRDSEAKYRAASEETRCPPLPLVFFCFALLFSFVLLVSLSLSCLALLTLLAWFCFRCSLGSAYVARLALLSLLAWLCSPKSPKSVSHYLFSTAPIAFWPRYRYRNYRILCLLIAVWYYILYNARYDYSSTKHYVTWIILLQKSYLIIVFVSTLISYWCFRFFPLSFSHLLFTPSLRYCFTALLHYCTTLLQYFPALTPYDCDLSCSAIKDEMEKVSLDYRKLKSKVVDLEENAFKKNKSLDTLMKEKDHQERCTLVLFCSAMVWYGMFYRIQLCAKSNTMHDIFY